jgi:23S rRNA pseudouridine2605 synthase
MRINKCLAHSGLGSRRAVEALVQEGAVAVNGKVVTDLATQVDPDRDAITVKGQPVHLARELVYILMNKPKGYDVTRGGEHHHRRACDLLPEGTHPSVQAVGRLDRNSTGLLLFTNDGELAYRLTHPRFGCPKIYEVEVEGTPDAEAVTLLKDGIQLTDGPARALEVEVLPAQVKGITPMRVVMAEGRKHIVRRMCEAVGYPVLSLNRVAMATLGIGTLRKGKTRPLRPHEIHRLRQAARLEAKTPEPPRERTHRGEDFKQHEKKPAGPRPGNPKAKPYRAEKPKRSSAPRDQRPEKRKPEAAAPFQMFRRDIDTRPRHDEDDRPRRRPKS